MTRPDVAVIDSGGANLASLLFALERLGARAQVTQDPLAIEAAPRVILPGVGSAPAAMQRLEHAGLPRVIHALRQPVLGICLGMQLLFEASAEGGVPCLGVLPGRVHRLVADEAHPVPHMGWNNLAVRRPDPLLEGFGADDYFYFVHGYAAEVGAHTIGATEYGSTFAAVVRRDNFCGTQFHPERSGRAGAALLRNFLNS